MINSTIFSSLDAVKARVQIYNTDDELVSSCTCDPDTSSHGVLSDFSVSREGVLGKFFGFGICHKLEMNIIDLENEVVVDKGYYAKISYGDGSKWDRCYPTFYFDEITVDKKTSDIKVIAYDKIKQLSNFVLDDVPKATSDTYGLYNILYRMRDVVGFRLKSLTDYPTIRNIEVSPEAPLNYEGTEELRTVVDNIAEVGCCIYYLDRDEYLIFKQVCLSSDTSDLTLFAKDYYEWYASDALWLKAIYATNELSDTVGLEVNEAGTVSQYMRENPVLTLRTEDDIQAIISANGRQFVHYPFTLDWTGDYRLEIGDSLIIHDPAGTATTYQAYILNDTVHYNGTLSEITSWEWLDNDSENENAPITVADKINQTFAKVDKVNREITLLTTEMEGYPQKMAQMQVTVDDVTTKVSRVEQVHTEELDTVNDRLDTLTRETALKVDAEGVEIIVEKTLSSGVDKVVTAAKKYTFDDTGLNVSSSGSNISTTITEDGMRIYRAGQEVLTADNEGVKAEDLHATTYLIIGKTSRLEDRENRTACFWIGD